MSKRPQSWKPRTGAAQALGSIEPSTKAVVPAHRASVEGPSSPCPAHLLRLSAGLEDPEDLYADLDQALERAHA